MDGDRLEAFMWHLQKVRSPACQLSIARDALEMQTFSFSDKKSFWQVPRPGFWNIDT